MPGELNPKKGQVSKDIEDLVTGWFIREPKGIVDGARLPKDDQIFRCGPASQPHGPQVGRLGFENESSRGGDFPLKRCRVHIHRGKLALKRGIKPVIEEITDSKPRLISRVQGDAGMTGVDSAGRGHGADVSDTVLWLDPRSQKGLDKRRGGTIHSRGLGRVDLDNAVVDAQAGQGSHHMFDQGDLFGAVTQGCAPLGTGDETDMCRNFGTTGKVHPTKYHPGVFRSGEKSQLNFRAGDKPDS